MPEAKTQLSTSKYPQSIIALSDGPIFCLRLFTRDVRAPKTYPEEILRKKYRFDQKIFFLKLIAGVTPKAD